MSSFLLAGIICKTTANIIDGDLAVVITEDDVLFRMNVVSQLLGNTKVRTVIVIRQSYDSQYYLEQYYPMKYDPFTISVHGSSHTR